MASILRLSRSSSRSASFLNKVSNGKQTAAVSPVSRLMSTQSGDDAKPPTALARLHLEDGSTLTGRSFGCHESVSGEVSFVSHVTLFELFYVICLLTPLLYHHYVHLSWNTIDRLSSPLVWLVTLRRWLILPIKARYAQDRVVILCYIDTSFQRIRFFHGCAIDLTPSIIAPIVS